jgi:hypothetical protein
MNLAYNGRPQSQVIKISHTENFTKPRVGCEENTSEHGTSLLAMKRKRGSSMVSSRHSVK